MWPAPERSISSACQTHPNRSPLGKHGQPTLATFEGVSSGLLDQADIDQAAALIGPTNSSACLLLYEHRWEEPLMSAIRRGGGQVVASERVPAEAVLAALDASESSQRSTSL